MAHIEQELPLGTVCRTLVLECDLQFAVLFLQLSLILLLLLFFCCSISCTDVCAAPEDHYEQDVNRPAPSKNQRKRFTEDGFFIRIRVEIERPSVAVHSNIAAGAVPIVGMGQRFGSPGFAVSRTGRLSAASCPMSSGRLEAMT